METIKNYQKANETLAMFINSKEAEEDRALFVHNIGVLLSQTREHVKEIVYHKNEKEQYETATIIFNNEYKKEVNITLDSYLAIVKDIISNI